MRRSALPPRRTGLRRTPIRRWARPPDDKVSPELAAFILARDQMCFAARIDFEHVCRDTYGDVHRADDKKRLTLDHVHDAATTGKRAPSDKYHLLALCGWANTQGWASAHRNDEREYLAMVNDDGG